MEPEMTREQWVEWYMASGLTREQAEEHLESIDAVTEIARRGEDV